MTIYTRGAARPISDKRCIMAVLLQKELRTSKRAARRHRRNVIRVQLPQHPGTARIRTHLDCKSN